MKLPRQFEEQGGDGEQEGGESEGGEVLLMTEIEIEIFISLII